MKYLVLSCTLFSVTATAQTLLERAIADPVDFEIPQQGGRFEQHFAKKSQDLTPYSFEQRPPTQNLESQINHLILQQKWQTLPELLARYQAQTNYDKALWHYAWGAFYYAQQQYSQAISHYQQFLALKPELAYPRFDYGVMLFENRQYQQAEEALKAAYPDLAPNVQPLAQRYLNNIVEQQRWQPYFSLQYVQTDNVNNTSAAQTVRINGREFVKDPASLPQKANGVRYGLGVEREINLSGNHFVRVELGYNGVYYWNRQDYSEQSIRFASGYAYRTAKQNWVFTPFIEQNWLGSPRYSLNLGASLNHSLRLSDRWRLSNSIIHTEKRYTYRLTALRHNGFQQRLINGVSLQGGRFLQFFANLEVMQDRTKEKASASHKWFSTLGARYYGQNWGNQLSIGYGKRYFHAPHYLYGYKRQDRELQFNVSLWHRKLIWKGFLPKLNFRYQKIISNMPDFYSRSSGEWFLTLEKDF